MIKTILILTAVAGIAPPAAPQSAPTPAPLPVAIVLVDELPFAEASAVVIRRKSMKPQNIVLVTKQTQPGDLTQAMSTLARSRARSGDQVAANMVAPIKANRTARQSRDHERARKDLDHLRTARARFVEGVGSRPVLFSRLNPTARTKTKG